MNRKFITGTFFILFSALSFSQNINFPDLQGFKKVTNYPVYQPESLWDFINGAADTYLALGFIDLHIAEYKKGKESIKLEIYRHLDHTLAFGIYASERSPSYTYLNLGSQGYMIDGVINFFTGNYYVKIRTYSSKAKTLKAQVSLSEKVAGMLGGETDMPALLSKFPEEGKKQNEETYINESVLGYGFLNKAFKATYESGNDSFEIYLIKTRSAQEANTTAQAYLKTVGLEAGNSDTGKFVVNDKYNGTVFLAWKDDMVVLISGLAKDQAGIADKYSSLILR